MSASQTTTSVTAKTRLLVTVTFLFMVFVNAMANILPINEKTTGQISGSYPNLFAPAGITFAIWGVIYLLLALYTLYQLGAFQKSKRAGRAALLEKVGYLFSISSLANAAWIFSWHYELIGLSMLLMIVILVCLILINRVIGTKQLTARDNIFIRLPFSVYFGWITVATIANAAVLLVSRGFSGFGLSEATWTVIMVLVGGMIGLITMQRNKDVAYGLVFIWAYGGILFKHLSKDGFGGQYPSVITGVIVCLVLLLLAERYLITSRRKKG